MYYCRPNFKDNSVHFVVFQLISLYCQMKEKIIKAGIIGSGFAAKFHFDALQRVYTAKVEVVGAYSDLQKTYQHLLRQRS